MAYPWVNTPPELYGWEVTNYNGIRLRNRSNFGDVFVNSSIFAGSERVKDGRSCWPTARRIRMWPGTRWWGVTLKSLRIVSRCEPYTCKPKPALQTGMMPVSIRPVGLLAQFLQAHLFDTAI